MKLNLTKIRSMRTVTKIYAEKSSVILSAVIILFCCALAVISYNNSSSALYGSICESLENRAIDNSRFLSQVFGEKLRELEMLASDPDIQSMNWEKQQRDLFIQVDRLKVKRFQIINKDGLLHSSNGTVVDVSDREYFAKAMAGVSNITNVFRSRIDHSMVIVCATPIRDEHNNVVGVLSDTIDYYELSKILEEIHVGKKGYAFLIDEEGATVAHPEKDKILSKETSLINMSKNPEYKELSNLEERMIKGETGFGFYSYNDVKKFMAYTAVPNTHWFLALTVPKNEVFNKIESLRYRFIIVTTVFVLGAIMFCYHILHFISEKQKVRDLQRSADENYKQLLEVTEMDQMKTEFFSNISHEFRTPLNVILGALQLFELYITNKKPVKMEDIVKRIKTMRQNCLRLLRLVNNLIDTTRIDSGYSDINFQDDNIVQVVEDITLSVADYIKQKNIEIIFDTEIEEKVMAFDHDKVERIMLNLLANATKFTSEGGQIFVNISDKGEQIEISIKDTGIGIPEDQLDTIFERFRQVDKSLTRRHEGSGIGLSLSKSLIEMHKGKISVKSELGKGSEFIILLPVKLLDNGEKNSEMNTKQINKYSRIETIHTEFSDIYM